ncbi:MAG: nucleotidyltransferase domain-containing protein [Bacilli bacterium]|nr:nucleotidyltransferase domain-containing protein [Bacilli bacterium]
MNELQKKRKDLGLTQIQAANSCGVSRRTYQNYEASKESNATYLSLLQKLDEMGVLDGSNCIVSVRSIKQVCREIFSRDYPEIECAYLFGSYARSEATGKSDVDILVVCPAMGMKFYGIASVLEERLHKQIDLHTHRQLVNNEKLLKEILTEGVKIYG